MPPNTLFETRYRRLTDLTGIGRKLSEKITYRLAEGVDPDEAEEYALGVIEKDPYALMRVDGIAFSKADAVALNDYDVDPDAPVRHKHGNREALKNDGCLPLNEFRSKRRKLGLLNRDLELEGVAEDAELIWLPEELAAEWLVARFVAQRLEGADHSPVPDAVPTSAQNAVMDQAGLNEDQRRVVKQVLYRRGLQVLTGGAGTGKCLAKGTPVLMADGSVMPVEKIQVGESVMGPDSKPRLVESLARGQEMMYQVTPTKGEPYTVNESHILSFRISYDRFNGNGSLSKTWQKDRIINLPVKEYLNLSKTKKQLLKGWRTGVEFPCSNVPLDPYILGIWLGDGHSDGPSLTTPDIEVLEAFALYGITENLKLVTYPSLNTGKAKTHKLAGVMGRENPFTAKLRQLGVLADKHVPALYKTNNRSIRLSLLAGLLDSDGHLCSSGCFDFISKRSDLSNDVAFLARSLGLAAYVKTCTKGCVYKGERREGEYFRVCISGDLSIIPTRVKRKQTSPRRQKKNVLNTHLSVKPVGVDDYYGFTLSGPDRLFLLGDFTVTHNTHSLGALARCAQLDRKTMHVMTFSGKAADRAAEVLGSVAKCTTIHRGLGLGRVLPEDEFGDPEPLDADIVVLDEASMIPTWLLARVVAALQPHATLLLTGDPAQLPPIGHGFPFGDIIRAGAPRVHLEQNYRQAGQVSLFELAEGIRTRAKWPTITEEADGLELHTDLSDDDLDHYSTGAVEFAKQFDLQDWICLTWKNQTREMLNLELQAMFNPDGIPLMEYPCWALGKQNGAYTFAEIRVGDKVAVRKNDYTTEIFNGQTGVVLERPDTESLKAEERRLKTALAGVERSELYGDQNAAWWRKDLEKQLHRVRDMLQKPGVRVQIKDRVIDLPNQEAEELLCLGYSVTVHKAQGSGWPLVIIFQPDEVLPIAMPCRFFYTAVTRASDHLFLFTRMGMGEFWRNATLREKLPVSTLLERIETLQEVNS